jgi:iron complex outermembrane receptor protein
MQIEMPRRRKPLQRVLTLLLAALLFDPARAAADDLTEMSLESLMNLTIVGASRYEQKSSDAPSYTSVVTAEDIRKNGYRNLADLLRSVPGFFVTNDRNYQYTGIRGLLPPGDYNTRILLVVDGHRINNSIYDEAPVGSEFPIDIDLVERVEVVRGPASSLYGSNAFFGIINIIT